MSPRLTELRIGDSEDLWLDLGFETAEGRCRLGTTDIVLTGSTEGRGIHGWTWSGAHSTAQVGDITTAVVSAPDDDRDDDVTPGPTHRNGAVGLFYVVLFGPSWKEAAGAVASLGLDPGHGVAMGSSRPVTLRSLADAGDVGVEVIGPEEPDPARGWRLWGIIVEVDDLDRTAEHLGRRLRSIKQAVQPGRRIATLDKAAGSTVATAFIGPDER
jgi:hypothetical protein